MRIFAILVACAGLGACSAATPTPSEQSLAHDSDWRQRQAELDVQAIIAGMVRARAAAEAQNAARTSR